MAARRPLTRDSDSSCPAVPVRSESRVPGLARACTAFHRVTNDDHDDEIRVPCVRGTHLYDSPRPAASESGALDSLPSCQCQWRLGSRVMPCGSAGRNPSPMRPYAPDRGTSAGNRSCCKQLVFDPRKTAQAQCPVTASGHCRVRRYSRSWHSDWRDSD
jgi:hypothetical protein